jgi:hypothetical protein
MSGKGLESAGGTLTAPAGEIQTFRVTGQDGRRLLAEPDPRIAGGQALDPVPIGGNRLSDRDRL